MKSLGFEDWPSKVSVIIILSYVQPVFIFNLRLVNKDLIGF